MTTIPENYNNIRARIVELLKSARSAHCSKYQLDYDRCVLGHWPAHRKV